MKLLVLTRSSLCICINNDALVHWLISLEWILFRLAYFNWAFNWLLLSHIFISVNHQNLPVVDLFKDCSVSLNVSFLYLLASATY